MSFKGSLIVAVSCLVLTVTARDIRLLQNPDTTPSSDCYNYYETLDNKLSSARKLYENANKGCFNVSDAGRTAAEAATLDARKNLEQQAEDSYSLLKKCTESESAVLIFTCYSQDGSANAITMNGISSQASLELTELLKQLRLIQEEEYRCSNEANRAYEMRYARALDDFNKCEAGKTEAPTDAPSTESPITAVPSPESPGTVVLYSEAPSTYVPSTSTDVPSTEDPSTSASSTVRNSSEEEATEEEPTEEESSEEDSSEED